MHIQAVDRALKILNTIAAHGDWVGVREISRATGLKAPTCQHLLKTLQTNGYLEFNEDLRRYRVGLAVMRLAESIDPIMRMADFARPFLHQLLADFNETITALTMFHGEVVVVEWKQADHSLTVHEPRRVIEQPHAMASGKLLLAFQDEKFQRNYAEHVFVPNLGANIAATKKELFEEFRLIRAQQYASVINPKHSGIGAYAAPVFDTVGKIVLAMACSAPLVRFDSERQQEVLQKLLQITRHMTTALAGRTSCSTKT